MTINTNLTTTITRPEQINTIDTRVDFTFNSLFNVPTNNVPTNRREDRDNFITIELINKSNENIYSGHRHKLRRCSLS